MSARMSQCATATWLAFCVLAVAGCAPEIGSERWCEAMRDKPRGDWSANEALDYAQHCILDGEEE